MKEPKNYLETNKKFWDARVGPHLESEFYNLEGFMEGETSLKKIELESLTNIKGLKVLHLQCHFGQDTLSLARMGAEVTGVDFSSEAIEAAQVMNNRLGLTAKFICADIYSLPDVHTEKYDLVFTSYGTIGWLPDVQKWAKVVSHFLQPGGRFVFVEFHPFIWAFDDDLNEVKHSYFNRAVIKEEEQGSYASPEMEETNKYVAWNHGLSEVYNALQTAGLIIDKFKEYDYSPYDVFPEMEEGPKGEFRISKWMNLVPLVYKLTAHKD